MWEGRLQAIGPYREVAEVGLKVGDDGVVVREPGISRLHGSGQLCVSRWRSIRFNFVCSSAVAPHVGPRYWRQTS